MTEKEKMLKQMMYDANYDKELLQERNQAKDLCYEYNQLRPSDEQGQKSVMRKLLGKTKENFAVMQPFWCDYGYNIEIGENFFANHNLVTSVSAAGAGKQLLQELETMAVSEGKEYLRLDCAVDNPVLNEYYESMGYVAAGHCQDGPYYGVRREKRLG